MVVCSRNPSTWEVEAEDYKFKAILGYLGYARLCLKEIVIIIIRAGEMAQKLRALTTLPEN